MLKMDKKKNIPCVSVIVPAYNVETYIKKCILSIIEQTYENIEIIAINDGSKDNSAQILDNIAKTENRLKVIHQKNAGVSAARNAGIDVATGEYIVFVDGDDYLASDYVEYMMSLAENGADFCLSTKCFMTQNEQQTKNETVKTYNTNEATALILSPDTIIYSPNKIFKKSFLDNNNLRFSTSLFYGEGLTFVVSASRCANFITVGNRKVYYYRRNNETSACTNFNIEKIYNGEKAIINLISNIHNKSKKINTMLILHLSMFYLGAIVRINSNNLKQMYRQDYKKWHKYIKKNIFSMLLNRYVSLYRKILLLVGCFFPQILSFLDLERRKRLSRYSV